jgi:polyphosphate glucokinase
MIDNNNVLGIDVGASGIKGAIVDTSTGKLLTDRIKISTPKPATPSAVAAVVQELILKLDYSGSFLGCGFPAIVKHGVANSAANIDPDWIGLNIETLFQKTTRQSVFALNDADAAGMAEMRFGKGKGKSGTILLITIGSGLGSALFIDGHLVPNTEFGHLHFHGLIAEHYISNTARKKYEMTWPGFGRRFNEFLHHVNRILSPDLVILGGGISNSFDLFAPYIDVNMAVTPAKMFNNAGIIGAAIYAKERFANKH